jgi:hypothetical protein
MKNCTKLRFALTVALIIGGMASAWAQQLPSTSLYRHGTNSFFTGTATDPILDYEGTDTVSIGATMDYFVLPDPAISPSYNPTNSLTADLNANSVFTWTATTGTVAQKAGMGPNYKTVNWAAAGLQSLKVVESNSVTACTDATGTTIPVRVISLPTATAGTVPSAPCLTADDGSLNHIPDAFPITFSSEVSNAKRLQVIYTITSGSNGTIATNQVADVTETNATSGSFVIDEELDYYDTYTITIVSVSDRISRKSNVTSTMTGQTFSYAINRTPKTGKIYHVPNYN